MVTPTVGQWYRLTNAFTGTNLALNVVNDAGTASSGTIQMAAPGNFSGQFWRLEHNPSTSTSTYALYTLFLGESKRLDVFGDDATKPHLANAGNYSGQIWTISPWGDGTWKLTNAYSGSNMNLDTYSDTKVPFMGAPDHTGQHWTFTPIDPNN
ncbi:carbohydrate-binding module family 13 protein [Crepidotus variabilis]|uniref:Carbohydrate-binding module family 13 protein n=1 Tax=Crepidotus variabilis TaxID=179855 RepID=A0A9P6EER9_9AGAR|nr:carbohydrate-binding module family 13 protein [Crepidotus variabilis]